MAGPLHGAPRGLTLDEALTKHIGEFGRSQIRILLIASIFWIGNALLILLMVFHASPSPIREKWWRCNDPADQECADVLAMDDPSQDFCRLPRSSWSWTQPGKSIISQFNLVCGAAWRSQFANSGFFMGYLIGSGLGGGLADSRGRKPVLFACTALGAVFTLLAGVSPNYPVYFLFRLLTGIGAAGQALTTYILATEAIGPSWRGTAGVGTQMFFIVGEFVLVLIAFVFRPWRALCFACAAFNALQLLLWPFIPESPRWLLVKGRRGEATAILTKIAAGNGRPMPTEPLAVAGEAAAAAEAPTAEDALHAEEGASLMGHSTANGNGTNGNGSTAKHAVSTGVSTASTSLSSTSAPSGSGSAAGDAKAATANGNGTNGKSTANDGKPVGMLGMLGKDRHMLRRFLVLAYVWLVMCMAYYGISLALGGLPGSIYVTFMITAAAEIPANVLAAWMIERYGRHNTMAAGMLLGGVACLACAFAPQGAASALLAAIGKFGCAGAFTIASIFTSEMFPTLVRSAVLGAQNQAARVGGISAPFIVLVGISTGQSAMPFIIFGVASLVAGVAIFTLPETLGTTLPDTMADMGGIQSIFTTQPWRKGGWRMTLREMFLRRGGPRPGARAAGGAGSPTPSGFGRPAAATTSPSHFGDGAGAGSGAVHMTQLTADGRTAAVGLPYHVQDDGEAAGRRPSHESLIHGAIARSDMHGGGGGGGGGGGSLPHG